MGLFEVKVFPCVVDVMVKTCNFETLFLVVFRPLLFLDEPALQQFQLALQTFKKKGRFYLDAVTGCQKLLQSNINPDRMTIRNWVSNTDITLKTDYGIPLIGSPQDSHLFNRKSCWNGSVQVNQNCSNFGQLNVQIRYGIFLELRKQQRLKLQ